MEGKDMNKLFFLFVPALAACTPSSDNGGALPGNFVAPSPIIVGSQVYTTNDCRGLQGHETYTVLAIDGDDITVEQQPLGSGRTFTVPRNCFPTQ